MTMSKSLQKPTILNVETVARSRLFNVESVDLEFSNGVRRVYERMRPSTREAVMIVPIVDDHIILIREYAVGTESYELGFSKGLIDPGETVDEAANRELKEEVGYGANKLTFLKKLSMAPSYFSSKMNIMVAEDLYPESLPGDEPEPLPQVRWPLAQLMSLLDEEDFNEARPGGALFLGGDGRPAPGRVGRRGHAWQDKKSARRRFFCQNNSWVSPPPSVRVVPTSRTACWVGWVPSIKYSARLLPPFAN